MVRGVEIYGRIVFFTLYSSEHCSIYRKLIIETELISVKFFPHNPVPYMAFLTSTIPEIILGSSFCHKREECNQYWRKLSKTSISFQESHDPLLNLFPLLFNGIIITVILQCSE